MDQQERRRIRDVYLDTNSQVETARITRHSLTTVNKTLVLYGLNKGRGGNQDKQRKVTDQEILDAITAGLTRQEIAERYSLHVENLARRMKKLGVSAEYAKKTKTPTRADWHYTEGGRRVVEIYQGADFEYIGTLNGRYRIRCKTCGAVTERSKSTIRQKKCECKACKESAKLEHERERLIRVFQAVLSAKIPKICECCGGKFFSQYPTAKYCEACKGARKNHHRARCRKYGVAYQYGISLRKLYIRDRGICQICGNPTDWNDKRWGADGPLYPTIDHILALANGGPHSWDNVQLAHAICNSKKRDVMAPPCGEKMEA